MELAELLSERVDVFFRSTESYRETDRYTRPANPDSLRELASEPAYWEQREENTPLDARKINVLWRPSQEDYEEMFEFAGGSASAREAAWMALFETGPRLQEAPVAQPIADRLEEKAAQCAEPKP